MSKTRILFTCATPLSGGGATVSLFRLLERIDRERFDPVLLAHETSSSDTYTAKFEELDVEVIRLRDNDVVGLSKRQERQAKRQSRGQIAAGLATLKRRVLPLKKGYELWTWARGYLGDEVPRSRRVAEILTDRGIDLLYLNDSFNAHRGDILAAKKVGVPCLSHMRTLDKIRFADLRILREVDYFVYMSKAIEESITLRWPQAAGRVLYDGVDLDAYSRPRDVAAVRAKYGLAPDDFVVGNVGRMVPWKGYDVFIRALGRIAKEAPKVKGLIVGAPTHGKENLLDELKDLCRREGVEDRVVFTGYCVDTVPLYGAMDINVHSATRPEPFGIVIIETLASGKPMVATRGGGPLETIEDGVDGLLVPMKEVEGMAAAILKLYRDPKLVESMGRAGQAKAQRLYSIERCTDEMQGILASLAQQKTPV